MRGVFYFVAESRGSIQLTTGGFPLRSLPHDLRKCLIAHRLLFHGSHRFCFQTFPHDHGIAPHFHDIAHRKCDSPPEAFLRKEPFELHFLGIKLNIFADAKYPPALRADRLPKNCSPFGKQGHETDAVFDRRKRIAVADLHHCPPVHDVFRSTERLLGRKHASGYRDKETLHLPGVRMEEDAGECADTLTRAVDDSRAAASGTSAFWSPSVVKTSTSCKPEHCDPMKISSNSFSSAKRRNSASRQPCMSSCRTFPTLAKTVWRLRENPSPPSS